MQRVKAYNVLGGQNKCLLKTNTGTFIMICIAKIYEIVTLATCLAMCSSVTRDASTCVRIDSVSTSCSIHTRAATAFVDI